MEQHPVPQNIASFKFKLFGSLTARQFFTLIIPLSLAALIFFSQIPALIRLPLSLILGIIAFVVALVPINGQPFDKWAVAFIHAVMSPTQRVWVKDKKVPDFLNIIVASPVLEDNIPEELSGQKRSKLFAYLKTLPKGNATPLDVKEQIALKDIDFTNKSFASVEPPRQLKTQPSIIWPASPSLRQGEPAARPTAPQTAAPTLEQAWAQPQQYKPSSVSSRAPSEPSQLTNARPKTAEAVKIEPDRLVMPATSSPRMPAQPQTPQPLPIRAWIEPTQRLVETTRPIISSHAKPYIIHGLQKRLTKNTPTSPAPEQGKSASPYTFNQFHPDENRQEPKKQEYVELISNGDTPAFPQGTVAESGEQQRTSGAKPRESIKNPTVNLASDTNYSLDNIIPIMLPNNQIRLLHGIGKTRARKLHFAPPENFDLSKLPIRGEKRFEVSNELKRHFQFEDTAPDVILPFGQKTELSAQAPTIKTWQKPSSTPTQIRNVPKSRTKPTVTQAPSTSGKKTPGNTATQKFSVTDLKKDIKTKQNLSSAEIIPLTSTPNVISGLVTDTSGAPITGAVIVVRDAFGIPVRALKTNKLGQFLSATPLTSGTYTIETENETSIFKPLALELKNQIVPPIAISAEKAK